MWKAWNLGVINSKMVDNLCEKRRLDLCLTLHWNCRQIKIVQKQIFTFIQRNLGEYICSWSSGDVLKLKGEKQYQDVLT